MISARTWAARGWERICGTSRSMARMRCCLWKRPTACGWAMWRSARPCKHSIRSPRWGGVADVSVPIDRNEVIQMVKADTGVEFTADKVVIRPTGAATAMMGGAFVTVDQHTLGDGIDMRHPGMDLVFAPDG